MSVRSEFAVHMLNEGGKEKARQIALAFSDLLHELERISGSEGRDMAIVKTKLEEACFFAKRAMAKRPENQQG